jgi:hypothetical protein
VYAPDDKDDVVTTANLREVAGVIVTMMGLCLAAFALVLLVTVVADRTQRAQRRHSDVGTWGFGERGGWGWGVFTTDAE